MIALYLESFGNPRKFSRIARRVGCRTPIVAVKGGASAAGARAAASHTAAAASPAVRVSALFRQAGIIAVDGLGELFDVVTLLAHQRLPAGRRLAIVGNAGGPLILAADAAAAATVTAVSTTPLAAVVLGQAPRVRTLTAPAQPGEPAPGAVPAFAVPEDAVRALSLAAEHAQWLRRPRGAVPAFDDVTPAAARDIIEVALTDQPEGCWLPPTVAADLLAAGGIPVARPEQAASAQMAADIAGRIGGPVALKAANPDLVHKSDRGGVRLDLATPAYRSMRAALGEAMGGAAVQSMIAPGVETLVGIVQDPAFGPLIGFGLGGVLTDLLADRSYRLLPLTDRDAAELVRSLRGSALLFGYRGSPPADVAALEDVLLRVAQLADDLPEIAEMDVSPLIVHEHGAVAVDVKIRVARVSRTPDPILRRLR
ncbi:MULTISPECIES: acetate--CoA ligase family protein [Protofrankia]|uniref:acetate--CoA ligase family protein n=1 Tax=Protofrankia TaxID=2994361 RepID=UPI0001C52ECE|nr:MULTISPECIES: acetate--CoA ligase family protein [Protofrankia]